MFKQAEPALFLMEMEGMSFRETIEDMAQSAGVAIPAPDPSAPMARRPAPDVRKAMHLAMDIAADRYSHELAGGLELIRARPDAAGFQADSARYVHVKRGIHQTTIERFRIGLAPDGWDTLKGLAWPSDTFTAGSQDAATTLAAVDLIRPREDRESEPPVTQAAGKPRPFGFPRGAAPAAAPSVILTLPDGQDPDEFVRTQGREAFDALVESSAKSLSFFLRDQLLVECGGAKTPEQRARFQQRFQQILKLMSADQTLAKEYWKMFQQALGGGAAQPGQHVAPGGGYRRPAFTAPARAPVITAAESSIVAKLRDAVRLAPEIALQVRDPSSGYSTKTTPPSCACRRTWTPWTKLCRLSGPPGAHLNGSSIVTPCSPMPNCSKGTASSRCAPSSRRSARAGRFRRPTTFGSFAS